jgi:hypothetical protein
MIHPSTICRNMPSDSRECISNRLAWSEWKFPSECSHGTETSVKVRRASIAPQIILILKAEVRLLIDCFRPRKGGQKVEALRKRLRSFGLKGVIVAITHRPRKLEKLGPPKLVEEGASGVKWPRSPQFTLQESFAAGSLLTRHRLDSFLGLIPEHRIES